MTTTLLALESSCDETAVALLRQEGGSTSILAENLYSQQQEHSDYGGVVPEIAARAHLQHFPHLIEQTFAESGMTLKDLNAIACTTGPGLIGGLLVGSMIGRTIAHRHRITFYGIHHLEGHLLSPRLPLLVENKLEFPYLALLASGGHTLVALAEAVGKYRILGNCRDDALGEAFDKSAIVMGLPYPGGPVLERYAAEGNAKHFALPAPLVGARNKVDREGCDFSFSGLKTAVARHWSQLGQLCESARHQAQCNMAASLHQAIAKTLCDRLHNALSIFRANYPDLFEIPVVFVGGVAANQLLRSALERQCQRENARLITVPLALCTDNAVMIGWAALERIQAGLPPDPAHDRARPRWSLAS